MNNYIEIISNSYSGYWNYLKNEIMLKNAWDNYFYGLIIISVVVFLLELAFPWRKNQPVIRKDFWLDTFYMFFNFFLLNLIVFVALSNVAEQLFSDFLGFFGITVSSFQLIDIDALPKVLGLLIFFIVSDFVQWNTHRLLHQFNFLWNFHKVHHSVKQMGFAAHLRYHWMEPVVYKSLLYIPIALIGGFDAQDVAIVHFFAITIGHLNHANIGWDYGVFKYILNNPKMHIWHHAKQLPENYKTGVNYGISLSIWDYLFKTNYIPHSGKDIELGFEDDEDFPSTFIGQELYPLTRKKIFFHNDVRNSYFLRLKLNMSSEHVVIIGNGIAGITAARHIRKLSDKKITIISAETDYFFSRTALMYVYMGHLKFEHTQPYEPWFWKKNNIELKKGYVETINTTAKTLVFDNAETMSYDKLIIATGSKPNKFGWSGEDADGVMGMYHKQDLENLEKYAPDKKVCKRAVIVGGGLIGIELAEMLRSRAIPVIFLVRENSFWSNVLPKEESAMINKHILEHHIDLRLNTNLKEIKTDENGKVKSVIIEETGEELSCNVVGLTAGVSPNVDFLKDSEITLGKGIKVNRFLETNVPDVYAIGDCAEQHEPIGNRRPIEAVWYTGRMMGETVAQTICGNKIEYQPGHWFNSAKFLDIEYQTYGWVWAEPKENEKHFYWEHESGKKSIRLSYDKNTHQFIGVNNFGIRMRHEFFDKMLTEKQSVEYVLEHLADANFDPEFYQLHEAEIVAQFNKENNISIKLKKKSWKRIFSLS